MSANVDNDTKLRTLSLFAGIGGIDLGLQRWCKTVCYVELDSYAQATLTKNMAAGYLDVAPVWDDVTTFGADEIETIENHYGTIEMVTGGDPCQENSNARQGVDARSPSLGHEFIRIVSEVRPAFVLRENPSAIRTDAPWPWQRFRSELESLGYNVLPYRMRACCVGADHQRERLFLFAGLPDALQEGLQRDEFCELASKGQSQPMLGNVARCDKWKATPRICGKADGLSFVMDRLKCLGNSVVSQCCEKAFEILINENLLLKGTER